MSCELGVIKAWVHSAIQAFNEMEIMKLHGLKYLIQIWRKSWLTNFFMIGERLMFNRIKHSRGKLERLKQGCSELGRDWQFHQKSLVLPKP